MKSAFLEADDIRRRPVVIADDQACWSGGNRSARRLNIQIQTERHIFNPKTRDCVTSHNPPPSHPTVCVDTGAQSTSRFPRLLCARTTLAALHYYYRCRPRLGVSVPLTSLTPRCRRAPSLPPTARLRLSYQQRPPLRAMSSGRVQAELAALSAKHSAAQATLLSDVAADLRWLRRSAAAAALTPTPQLLTLPSLAAPPSTRTNRMKTRNDMPPSSARRTQADPALRQRRAARHARNARAPAAAGIPVDSTGAGDKSNNMIAVSAPDMPPPPSLPLQQPPPINKAKRHSLPPAKQEAVASSPHAPETLAVPPSSPPSPLSPLRPLQPLVSASRKAEDARATFVEGYGGAPTPPAPIESPLRRAQRPRKRGPLSPPPATSARNKPVVVTTRARRDRVARAPATASKTEAALATTARQSTRARPATRAAASTVVPEGADECNGEKDMAVSSIVSSVPHPALPPAATQSRIDLSPGAVLAASMERGPTSQAETVAVGKVKDENEVDPSVESAEPLVRQEAKCKVGKQPKASRALRAITTRTANQERMIPVAGKQLRSDSDANNGSAVIDNNEDAVLALKPKQEVALARPTRATRTAARTTRATRAVRDRGKPPKNSSFVSSELPLMSPVIVSRSRSPKKLPHVIANEFPVAATRPHEAHEQVLDVTEMICASDDEEEDDVVLRRGKRRKNTRSVKKLSDLAVSNAAEEQPVATRSRLRRVLRGQVAKTQAADAENLGEPYVTEKGEAPADDVAAVAKDAQSSGKLDNDNEEEAASVEAASTSVAALLTEAESAPLVTQVSTYFLNPEELCPPKAPKRARRYKTECAAISEAVGPVHRSVRTRRNNAKTNQSQVVAASIAEAEPFAESSVTFKECVKNSNSEERVKTETPATTAPDVGLRCEPAVEDMKDAECLNAAAQSDILPFNTPVLPPSNEDVSLPTQAGPSFSDLAPDVLDAEQNGENAEDDVFDGAPLSDDVTDSIPVPPSTSPSNSTSKKRRNIEVFSSNDDGEVHQEPIFKEFPPVCDEQYLVEDKSLAGRQAAALPSKKRVCTASKDPHNETTIRAKEGTAAAVQADCNDIRVVSSSVPSEDNMMMPPPSRPTTLAKDHSLMPPPPLPTSSRSLLAAAVASTPSAADRNGTRSTNGSRFIVDGRGQVSAADTTALKEVYATPLQASADLGRRPLQGNSMHSGRLFAAHGDIYSSTRKPTHARIGRPIQSSAQKQLSSALAVKKTRMRAPLVTLSMLEKGIPVNDVVGTSTGDGTNPSGESLVSSCAAAVTHACTSLKQIQAPGSPNDSDTMLSRAKPESSPPCAPSPKQMHASPPVTKSRPDSQPVPVVPVNSLSTSPGYILEIDKSDPTEQRSSLRRPIEDLYKTEPAPNQKRARIAFVEPTSNESIITPSARIADAQTAPLKNVRRPRIVLAKSALRSRIEGLQVASGDIATCVSADDGGTDVTDLSAPTTAGLSSGSAVESSHVRARVHVTEKEVCSQQDQDGNVGQLSASPTPSTSGPRLKQPPATSLPMDPQQTVPSSQLGNLMTSITSFLPSFRIRKETKMDETEEQRAEAAIIAAKADADRREAEVAMRREAARLAKQKEADEKQRRAEAKRRLMAQAEIHREEERQRKEADRARKLQEAEELRRKVREEEERRREEKRRRVEEQQRRLAADEEKRRLAIQEKEKAHRELARLGFQQALSPLRLALRAEVVSVRVVDQWVQRPRPRR
jgi:hypothetical protein